MHNSEGAPGNPAQDGALDYEAYVRIAHDLRNPLAPIRTAVQLLRMVQGDPVRSKELLDLIERQVGHLVRLIDRLTDYGELQSLVADAAEPVDLTLAIDQAVGNCSAVIGAAGHQLQLDLPERQVVARGDPRRVAQALSMVIENAAKFQAAGGTIEVSLRREGGWGVVRVRDRGFGMSPATLASLYRPFTRGATPSPHMPGGLGLGLVLARAIVERQGGSVEASSAGEGQGSEIALSLPLSG